MSIQSPFRKNQKPDLPQNGQHSNGHASNGYSNDVQKPVIEQTPTPQISREEIDREEIIAQACNRIAPLWPLKNFVAVNPFLGLTEKSFAQAAGLLKKRAGASMTAPRSFYAQAIRSGRVTESDLAAVLAEDTQGWGVDELKKLAETPAEASDTPLVPTVAQVAEQVTNQGWRVFVNESTARWAASYFDQGQAYWTSPWQQDSPFQAWLAEAKIDRTPQVMGLPNVAQAIAALPANAPDVIDWALAKLEIPQAGLEAYLHRLLVDLGGWAGAARYRRWEAELRGGQDETMTDLLAIRLVWEVLLLDGLSLHEAWGDARNQTAIGLSDEAGRILAGDLLLQRAFEQAYQRDFIQNWASQSDRPSAAETRVQAAFCIDVRSEVFRRALESTDAGVETIGFAGFFGFPVEYVRLGEEAGGAQCPALIPPQFVIKEGLQGASQAETEAMLTRRSLQQKAGKAWRSFKFGAASCFGFVGPVGFAYLKKLVTDSLGKSRPVNPASDFGLSETALRQRGPTLSPGYEKGSQQATGMSLAQMVETAAGALKGMSLTKDFARIVLFAGHGSTTANNPYASGLDCGACGGHTGEANARVAAKVLNDPAVRMGLKEKGIHIPQETLFVAGLHDTTTDELTLYTDDLGSGAGIPASHKDDFAQLTQSLAEAGRLARTERADLLGISPDEKIDAAVMARSKDWSQVRPEWGLAGCASFIVAPRSRTASADLDGRAFLHSYDWHSDEGYGVLELIMTAPMVVASWINLQYYGSTVDNRMLGSGNKVLHNVVGSMGVLEGNSGELRTGLPWQSVHDGERYIHEPLRLNVFIEAPLPAMTEIIATHESVRQLVDNQWIHLFALDESGQIAHKYAGDLTWEAV